MPLESLINLIAEVAAKRAVENAHREAETASAVFLSYCYRSRIQAVSLGNSAFSCCRRSLRMFIFGS